MYSTCLLCADSLGTNAVLETLPVGRRVAFDPAKGRLWVVCPGCARWNLVPFDSRFLAIEDCERHFRDTHVRFSTGTIGIARLPEGLELVRIGPALRPSLPRGATGVNSSSGDAAACRSVFRAGTRGSRRSSPTSRR